VESKVETSDRLRRVRLAFRRLSAFQEAVQRAGGAQKTPEEVVENLRAIRQRLWEEEYAQKYAHRPDGNS